MKRTVSRMGNSSLVMSLPSQWVKENNVKAGDEIEVETDGPQLKVSLTQITLPEKTLERNIQNYSSRTVLNILNYAYRSGYTKIILQYKNQSQLDYLTQTVHTLLMGFEVIEQNNGKCLIQNIGEPSVEKVEIIIRKIFLLIKQLGDEIVHKIEKDQTSANLHIQQTKDLIDYFTNIARRSIISLQYPSKERSYFLWSLVNQLSLICHAYSYFNQALPTKTSSKFQKSVSTTMKSINNIFETVYQSFYKEDLDSLNRIDQERAALNQEIFILVTQYEKSSQTLCYLYELVRQVQMASSFIFGWHLNNSS